MQAHRAAHALGLALLLALSTVAAPASAQDAVQDPKQPSVDNPHMHIYGNDDLSNCFAHFDGNDTTGSAEQGYGEEVWPNQNGQQIEMDYTCKMEESFKQDMYLNPNGTIQILLNFNIDADGECTGDRKCENLNLTLYKGTFQIARQEFPSVDRSGQDETVTWDINIDKNMTRFNRTQEPQLRVEYSYPGYDSPLTCIFFYCGGSFRMYYHTPGNDSAEVGFPVVNQTIPGEGGGDGDGIGGAVSDALPGFGLVAGIGALALAAVGASRFTREE